MKHSVALRKILTLTENEGHAAFPNDKDVSQYQLGYLASWIGELIEKSDEDRIEQINDIIKRLEELA